MRAHGKLRLETTSVRLAPALLPQDARIHIKRSSNPVARRELATVTGRRPPVGYHCPRKAGKSPGEGGTPASTLRDKPTLLGNPAAGLHHQPRMVKTADARRAWLGPSEPLSPTPVRATLAIRMAGALGLVTDSISVPRKGPSPARATTVPETGGASAIPCRNT